MLDAKELAKRLRAAMEQPYPENFVRRSGG